MTARPELLARAARHAERYLDAIHERSVGAMVSGDALRRLLRRPLAEEGEDNGQIVDDLAQAGQVGTTASQGPRYFGENPSHDYLLFRMSLPLPNGLRLSGRRQLTLD